MKEIPHYIPVIRFSYDQQQYMFFAWHILSLVSVDEILLPRYVNQSANFRVLGMDSLCLKHMNCFICIHVEANAWCYLLLYYALGIQLGQTTLAISQVYSCIPLPELHKALIWIVYVQVSVEYCLYETIFSH